MSIVMIYPPEERQFVQPLHDALVARGCDVKMAPLGLQVESQEWSNQVRSDITDCAACIVLLSDKSVVDKSVAARVDWALKEDKRIVPVVRDEFRIAPENWKLAQELARYNRFFLGPDSNINQSAKSIHDALIPLMPKKVFISYSRKDEVFVDKIEKFLRAENFKVWRDTSSIRGGTVWDNEIQNALSQSDTVLLVASANSILSENVADEIGYARTIGKPIVPLMIEDVQLPFRIHRAQSVDFRNDFASASLRLIDALAPIARIHEAAAPVARSRKAAFNAKRWMAVGAGVGLITIASLAFWPSMEAFWLRNGVGADDCVSRRKPVSDAPRVVENYVSLLSADKGKLFYGWEGGIASTNASLENEFKITDIFAHDGRLSLRYDWQHGLLDLTPVVLAGTVPVIFFEGSWRQDNGAGCIKLGIVIPELYEQGLNDKTRIAAGTWSGSSTSEDQWSARIVRK